MVNTSVGETLIYSVYGCVRHTYIQYVIYTYTHRTIYKHWICTYIHTYIPTFMSMSLFGV